jgi:hypothetical protein
LNRPPLLVEQADGVGAFYLELKLPFTGAVKQNGRPARVRLPAAAVVCDHWSSKIGLTQMKDTIRPEVKVVANALAICAGQSALESCRQLKLS